MTRDDARNFLAAVLQMQPYVPPMIFNQIAGNPVTRELERLANTEPTGEVNVTPIRRDGA